VAGDRSWRCGSCGRVHTDLPFAFAAPEPHAYVQIPADERAARAAISSDTCVIDGRWFFVRGVIEIPVMDETDRFEWGVWISLSDRSYRFVVDSWNDPDRASSSPMFGWLNTRLPVYPDTLNLKAMVHLRSGNLRPRVEVEPTDHPLAVEQRTGITVDRLCEVAVALLHG
jgi:hypothetical protein